MLALCISKIVKTAKNWTNTVADNKKNNLLCVLRMQCQNTCQKQQYICIYIYMCVLALCISKIVKTAKNWTNTVADNKKKHIVCLACAVSKYKSKC